MIGTAAAYVFPPLGLVACFAASALLIKWLLERRQVGEWRKYAPLPLVADTVAEVGGDQLSATRRAAWMFWMECRP